MDHIGKETPAADQTLESSEHSSCSNSSRVARCRPGLLASSQVHIFLVGIVRTHARLAGDSYIIKQLRHFFLRIFVMWVLLRLQAAARSTE